LDRREKKNSARTLIPFFALRQRAAAWTRTAAASASPRTPVRADAAIAPTADDDADAARSAASMRSMMPTRSTEPVAAALPPPPPPLVVRETRCSRHALAASISPSWPASAVRRADISSLIVSERGRSSTRIFGFAIASPNDARDAARTGARGAPTSERDESKDIDRGRDAITGL
jgi:hypothetical protein